MGNYSTNQAAAKLGLSPNTLREAHCTKGSYFGVKPLKCHNRMLRWPADQIDALMQGKAA